jgi:hypothetical protein
MKRLTISKRKTESVNQDGQKNRRKKTKKKPRSTHHYTENYKLSNTNPTRKIRDELSNTIPTRKIRGELSNTNPTRKIRGELSNTNLTRKIRGELELSSSNPTSSTSRVTLVKYLVVSHE